MRDVSIVGVGIGHWGELWNDSLRDLAVAASLKAIADAGVDRVDSAVIGCMSSGIFTGQEHLASVLGDYLGRGPLPVTRVESACASGALAFKAGYAEVAAGISDVVLVCGAEKMNDLDGSESTYALGTAADQEYEGYNGATFPGLYAMMALRHMHEFGTTRRQLSLVAVKNHANGLQNPNAQFQMAITPEDVEKSAKVADPLRLLDCSPVTDGAAALILVPTELAKKLAPGGAPVAVRGIGHATDTIALHSRASLTRLRAVEVSAERAYQSAGVKPADIHLAEVHDCFTIAELMAMEALGFAAPGQSGPMVERGETAIGGRIPINPSGGLKSKGHPVGATGVAQILEIVEQLRGQAGGRQVKGAKLGLAQNMGGTGGSSIVTILGA
ncbi:MAG: acetyl-CoA acetyltransferase [Elusimicrobia bacterium GWA2_69_24]|nr:MAG: acetyl-CoA acetyltransferase [Elusimicrobia bacterium GWA2_69_24]HBL18529.1 thiolase domain-containing protein [Elusimicrobiota bacterium]